MDRKSPYEHPVSGHYRNGKWIDKYTRGEGKAPGKNKSRAKSVSKGVGSVYNVLFTFPDGGTESYNHRGTATSALKAAIGDIQRPMVPKRATLTMIGG
jgi:hypothetical protein